MVKFFKILSQNPSQTKKIGKILAREILGGRLTKKVYPVGSRRDSCGALVLGLVGDLGGGKTTFLQGFAKGLGIKEKILSPSFVILRRFEIKDLRFKNFYHIDCYRISKPKEILDLGFKEIISDPKNIIAIEWADRIKKILPKKILILKFDFINHQNQRKIEILNYV